MVQICHLHILVHQIAKHLPHMVFLKDQTPTLLNHLLQMHLLNIVDVTNVVEREIYSQQVRLRHMAMTKKSYVRFVERSIGHPMYITIENVAIAMVLAKSESENEVCHIKNNFCVF